MLLFELHRLVKQESILPAKLVMKICFLESLKVSVLLAALASTLSSAAQDNRSAVIRTTTRVVNVNLVVTDQQGDPLKDLTKDEILVLDDGQPQTIAFFSAVDNETLSPPIPSLPANIFTNHPEGNVRIASATIVLFDLLNSRWTSQGIGLASLRKFLRQVHPQDHIGLYTLGDEMKVLHDFRTTAAPLLAAVERYDTEHAGNELPAGVAAAKPAAAQNAADTLLDRFFSGKENSSRPQLDPDCRNGPQCFAMKEAATELTTASLEAIARQLSPIPGRKTLIWVTDNIPGVFVQDDINAYLSRPQAGAKFSNMNMPPYVDTEALERMMRIMNGSGIAVYPVSSEGLETADLGFRNTKGQTLSGGVADLQTRLPDRDAHLYMAQFAERTGGRAFLDRNDIDVGLRRALDDARFTYSLAYYPDHNKWKGEWRKIQVKVNRPGVTVLARNGYFAFPEAQALQAKDRYVFLSSITASPVDWPQLPMAVRVTMPAGAVPADGPQLNVLVHFNPQALISIQDTRRWKGSFEVLFLQIGAKNKLLDLSQKSIDADMDANQYASAGRKGFDLPVDLKFFPGAEQLCVVLRDKLSDAVGSVHIPLQSYSAELKNR
jgi:VWFA-related protein